MVRIFAQHPKGAPLFLPRRQQSDTAGGAVTKVGFDNAAAKSEAAQERMRLDPTQLTAVGAVTKVGSQGRTSSGAFS